MKMGTSRDLELGEEAEMNPHNMPFSVTGGWIRRNSSQRYPEYDFVDRDSVRYVYDRSIPFSEQGRSEERYTLNRHFSLG